MQQHYRYIFYTDRKIIGIGLNNKKEKYFMAYQGNEYVGNTYVCNVYKTCEPTVKFSRLFYRSTEIHTYIIKQNCSFSFE